MFRSPILAATLVLGGLTATGGSLAQPSAYGDGQTRYRQLIERLPPSERPRPDDPRWTNNGLSPSVGRFGLPLSGPAARGGMTGFR